MAGPAASEPVDTEPVDPEPLDPGPLHPGPVEHELAGQVALVTGGTRGIGRAISELLARRGAHVVVASRHGEQADEVSARLQADGYAASAIELDVRNERMVDECVANVVSELGGIHILINNAGTSGPPVPLWQTTTEYFDDILRVHLYGTFFCIRAVVPHMLDGGYGRIVNLASVAGKEGNPQKAAYSAAKAGVIGLTKSVGKELALSGILVNAVAPTVIETAILDQTAPEHLATLTAKIPMGRRGEPAEVAELVAFAASRRCSFTTGAVFDISGGRATY